MRFAFGSKDVALGFASIHIDRKTKDLHVANANLTDEDIKQLCNLIKRTPIRSLNLCNNHIQDEGAKLLSDLNNKNLRRLVLDNNEISQAGAKYLVRSPIENISIRSNLLSDDSFQAEHKTFINSTRSFYLNMQRLIVWATTFKIKK